MFAIFASIMTKEQIRQTALRTISLETESVAGLAHYINDDFINAANAVYATAGRLVISGIGKSAVIAQKIVATLNSTGTPSLFMHAADAIHGDLGMIQQDDIVMIISKSGESPEIKVLVPLVKNFGNPIIAMAGNEKSFLCQNATYILNTTVSQEACPNNLAPTSSTTAQMVMGDALAVCLMELRGFSGDDFAKFHPGGLLGKKLYLRVQDIYINNPKPFVLPSDGIKRIIISISEGRMGMTVVVDESKQIQGVITDGDLRRMLEKETEISSVKATDIMSKGPKMIEADALAVDALDKLRKYDITQLVVAENNKYCGIIHLHDLVKEGLI
ncbi:KpsF/GutQ family sugar-phosphate isomerase [Pinibacter soli]|uniref:KpsF/GutQ family sugar-phosphate isomerase n=1 Tax=Pinibacter soli TaxID=3044211 RepID=A0ABT6R8C7_9BACT|nr:KpsF/GutQ family sugar-phosphate isomerase [Pinibacter soli]MDI3318815.1 KpsF/GutQ family sugar-phosphate isomerase [Pinibacter soli]